MTRLLPILVLALLCLAPLPGRADTLPRLAQLLDSAWSYDAVTESNVVDIYIHYLRNKIDKGFDKKLLRTVRGVGYASRAD